MHKIVNTGAPPTTDAAPVTNHPVTPAASTATHATGHSATSSGGGGT